MTDLMGTHGMKTAVADAVSSAQSVSVDSSAEQLALLPLPISSSVSNGGAAENGAPAARGAGRPPGAKNKSTEAWRTFLLTRYSSPLQGLAEIYSRPVRDLAQDLGLKPELLTFEKAFELLKFQASCMKELAPYIHQKMPQAVEGLEGGLMQLVINTGAPAAEPEKQAGFAVKILDLNIEQNQGVIDADFTDLNASDLNESQNIQTNHNDANKKQSDYVSVGEGSV